MTIGELFVKLGFKIDGAEDFKKVAQDLKDSAATAGKLALGVDAMTAAFMGMLGLAMSAGQGLEKFRLATGLSTTDLQQWQFAAAKAGVSGQELEEAVKRLQMVTPKILMGGGEGMAAWTLLGLNPTENPFVTLAKLSKELGSFDDKRVAAARYLVSQIGMGDNMFQMLRRGLGAGLPSSLTVTPEEIKRLDQMKGSWNAISFEIGKAGERFSAMFKPGLDLVLGLMDRLLNKIGEFTTWLNSGTPEAERWKTSLNYIGLALVGLSGALSAFAIFAKVGSMAFGALNVAAAPFLFTMRALAAASGLALVALEGLMLLKGERERMSDTSPGEEYMRTHKPNWLTKKYLDLAGKFPGDMSQMHPNGASSMNAMKDFSSAGLMRSFQSLVSSLNITINGVDANNTSAVGRATYDSVTRALMNTQYQQPAQSR